MGFQRFYYFDLEVNIEARLNMKNTAKFATTIVAPVGVDNNTERIIPAAAQITEIIDEQIVTLLKLLKIRIAESAGKIISADTSSEPTRFMARTIIIAVMIAIIKLYLSELIPVALEKLSSKVTLNILL